MSEGRMKSFKNKGKDAAVSYRAVFTPSSPRLQSSPMMVQSVIKHSVC